MKNNDFVYIKLDRPRLLWFSIKAQKKAESSYGLSRDVIIEKMEKGGLNAEETVQLVTCMLERDAREHGETLTEAQVEDLLDCVRPGKISRAVTDCLMDAFAPAEDEDDACGEDGCPLGL